MRNPYPHAAAPSLHTVRKQTCKQKFLPSDTPTENQANDSLHSTGTDATGTLYNPKNCCTWRRCCSGHHSRCRTVFDDKGFYNGIAAPPLSALVPCFSPLSLSLRGLRSITPQQELTHHGIHLFRTLLKLARCAQQTELARLSKFASLHPRPGALWAIEDHLREFLGALSATHVSRLDFQLFWNIVRASVPHRRSYTPQRHLVLNNIRAKLVSSNSSFKHSSRERPELKRRPINCNPTRTDQCTPQRFRNLSPQTTVRPYRHHARSCRSYGGTNHKTCPLGHLSPLSTEGHALRSSVSVFSLSLHAFV